MKKIVRVLSLSILLGDGKQCAGHTEHKRQPE